MVVVSSLLDNSGNTITKGSKVQVLKATEHTYHAASKDQVGIVNCLETITIGENITYLVSVKLLFPNPHNYDLNSSEPPQSLYWNIYINPSNLIVVDPSTPLNMDGTVLRTVTTKTPKTCANGFQYIELKNSLVKWRWNPN